MNDAKGADLHTHTQQTAHQIGQTSISQYPLKKRSNQLVTEICVGTGSNINRTLKPHKENQVAQGHHNPLRREPSHLKLLAGARVRELRKCFTEYRTRICKQ